MDIHQEARAGTLTSTKTKQYLQYGSIDDEDTSGSGLTPLAAAAKAGHVHVVKLLCENQADVNKKSKYGCTPLYFAANAKAKRSEITQLLLTYHARVDETDDGCDNETPLMVAITQARDPKVVSLLYNAGASLTKKNDKGETAQLLADQSGNPAIKNAIIPPDQRRAGLSEAINAIVSLVLFILAYVNSGMVTGVVKGVVSSLYSIGVSTGPDQDLVKASAIDNPTTVDEFQDSINDYVAKSDLGQFFAPGNKFLEKVAEKATQLKEDPNNHLTTAEHARGLTRLAMYQPILYCDDSGSMQEGKRMENQKKLVRRMTSIVTRLVPDGSGAHLRFINKSETGLDNLNKDSIEKKVDFKPVGGTMIGTNLKKKILEPFIYNVIEQGGKLERPYLILIITDGQPNEDDSGVLKDAIVDCGKRLSDRGYPQEAVMFLISQIGQDEKAKRFLDDLEGNAGIDRVLFRTAEQLDSKYAKLRGNEQDIEEWLFGVLMQPIVGRYDTD